MTKKLICLLLAMIMVLGMFVGCAEEDENIDPSTETADTQASKRVAMTLSLWLPTDDGTTEEAKELVEEAINKITQAKYDTAIELHLIPRSEYKETIDAKIEAVKKATADKKAAEEARRKELKNKGQKVEDTTETEPEPEETLVNDLGITITAYPEVADTQLDIFFVSGYENYSNYAYSNIAMALDGELTGASKIIKTYVHPTFLKVIYDYGTFAIPNNHPVGEYEYLLINKELVDEYDYNISDLSSLMRCENFIIDIGNQGRDDVVPLLGPIEASGLVYWGEEFDTDWSVFASQISAVTEYTDVVAPEFILDNQMYTNTLKLNKKIQELGYCGDGTLKEGQKFAVGIVKGDISVLEQYEDEYYVSVYTPPMFQKDDVYGAMFAVSEYTKNSSRAMEIITCINTDHEMRTVLQYGVEGIHWEYDDPETKETISIISDDYKMELIETGNVFMTYPGEGISMDFWEIYKTQNLEAIASPYIKMSGYVDEDNEEIFAELERLNKEYKEKLDAITSENFNAELRELKNEILSNETIQKLLDPEDKESLVSIYTEWQDGAY